MVYEWRHGRECGKARTPPVHDPRERCAGPQERGRASDARNFGGDIAINGAFVPHHQVVPAADILEGRSPGAKLHSNTLYSMPMIPLIQCEVLPCIVSTYQGAVGSSQGDPAEGSVSYFREDLGKAVGAIRLGKALTGIALAEDMLRNYIDLILNMDKDEIKTVEARAVIRARVASITDFCANGVNEVMLGSDASTTGMTRRCSGFSGILSMLRVHGYLDLETGSQALGRVSLGLPPQCVWFDQILLAQSYYEKQRPWRHLMSGGAPVP